MSSEELPGLLLDELSDALGGDARVILTEDLERFAEPARGPAGHVDLVLAPASTWQLRVIIRWARDNRLQLLPQGANSGLVEASTPGPDDLAIVLSTDRMVGEIIINPSDRTAVVPAGIRLSKLNEELAAHGLRLPIDLGADPSVGGMAATNTGGARMIRHGDMRRHVLGIEAVLADDEVSVVEEISTLRKDNSGLSLTQLLVGSGGSLGVITRVAVEVEPIPSSTACAWLIPTDTQSVIGCLGLLESRWGSHLSAFEVASANAMGAALDHVADLRDPFAHIQSQSNDPGGPRVLVEFEALDATSAPADAESCSEFFAPTESRSESVDSDQVDHRTADAESFLVSALATLQETGLILDAVVTPTQDAWRLRHSISEGLRLSGTVIGFDISVPRSRIPDFLTQARSAVHREFPRASVADFGHWGDGGVHCNVVVPFEEPLSAVERGQLRQLVFGIAVEDFSGTFSAEHGVGPANADWWRHSKSPGSQRLTHAIKVACDPLDILGHPRMPY